MCNSRTKKIISFLIDENATCAICMKNGTQFYLPCNHKFHVKCLLTWLFVKVTCPLCRTPWVDHVLNHRMNIRDYYIMDSVKNIVGHKFYD